MQNKMERRFLIIRWSGLGDVVMTLPAVHWLQTRFPACRITYLTDPDFTAVFTESTGVDSVETIDRRGFKSPSRGLWATGKTLATLVRLRNKGFHAVFDLQGFGETAILAYLTGAPMRVGRVKGSTLRKRIYTGPINADWELDHRSVYFQKAIANAFGENPPASLTPPSIGVDNQNRPASDGRIGLNIGASTESRRWSETHFIRLAQNLSRREITIRFFLGPQEAVLKPAIRAACQIHGFEYCSTRTIPELMDALGDCRLLVSNDTGPGHLAAALGIPVVTLFSTGDPDNVRPLAPKACWFRDRDDINRIPVEQVTRACIELLDAKNPDPHSPGSSCGL
jgi:heptosyltransferase I